MADTPHASPTGPACRRRADSLFRDLLLPDETRAIREEARRFAEEVVQPIAHQLNTTPERRDGFPRPVFDAMARAGL